MEDKWTQIEAKLARMDRWRQSAMKHKILQNNYLQQLLLSTGIFLLVLCECFIWFSRFQAMLFWLTLPQEIQRGLVKQLSRKSSIYSRRIMSHLRKLSIGWNLFVFFFYFWKSFSKKYSLKKLSLKSHSRFKKKNGISDQSARESARAPGQQNGSGPDGTEAKVRAANREQNPPDLPFGQPYIRIHGHSARHLLHGRVRLASTLSRGNTSRSRFAANSFAHALRRSTGC